MNTVTPPLAEFRPIAFDAHANESLLVRWFVRFNPLFSLSALCVLGGVLLLSRAWRDVGVGGVDGVVAISIVVELYQWLAIATAALLYRRLNEHRPGVILGLIALAFAIDPTLQLSGLAAAGHVGLSALWVVGVALKVEALAAAFCLRLSTSARLLPTLSAALLALLPNLRLLAVDIDLDVADSNSLAIVFVVGVLGLAIFATTVPPTVTSSRALDDDGQLAFARIRRAIVAIGLVGAVLQGGNAMLALGSVALAPLLGAIALVVILVVDARSETGLWVGVVTATIMLTAAQFGQLGPVLVGVALLVAGRPDVPHRFAPRVVVAGLVSLALPSIHLLNAFGDDTPGYAKHLFVVVALSIALVGVLVSRRAWSALAALLFVHAKSIGHVVSAAADDVGSTASSTASDIGSIAAVVGARGAGLILVVVGFGLVPAGVVLHRRLTAGLRATSMSPTSSAAPGI